MPAKQLPSNRRAYLLAALLLLALCLWLGRSHLRFDAHAFAQQFHSVSWLRIALGMACIYASHLLRAVRWSVLLAPVRKTPALHLFPAQLIGFTAVALFGRFADLGRPWLIARRLHTPIATQVAVYSIERAFDLAAAAILFSATLAFAPRNTPHHAAFARAGALSLAATLLVVAAALIIRFSGDSISRLAHRVLHPISARLATAAAARVLDLRAGFRTISTLSEFLAALALSLLLWTGIAASYLLSATAFRASPQSRHVHSLRDHAAAGLRSGRLAAPAPRPRMVHPDRRPRRRSAWLLRRADRDRHRLRRGHPAGHQPLHRPRRTSRRAPSGHWPPRRLGRIVTAMKCPFCAFTQDKVIDSRESKDADSIRRRRECERCNKRFTTYERLDEIPYMVVKKDGRREKFDRQKVLSGLLHSCQKRKVSVTQMQEIVDAVEAFVIDSPERERPTTAIGELIMSRLKDIDTVAYIRFASVYRDFKDVNEFKAELEGLLRHKEPHSKPR